jgi:hypothetical protein
MGVTSGAETKKPSGAPEFPAMLSEVDVARCLAFCVLWILIFSFAFFFCIDVFSTIFNG